MRHHLDIELLHTLIAIADTGGFASAAAAVHRTQSAVSMQMKRLEDVVGQRLFEKQGRRAVLTLHGQNLLLYARRILKLQDEALAAFRSPEVTGELRVGICDDYVMSLMPAILSHYAELYPQVHIRLDSQSSAKLIAATYRGDLDLSLVNIISDDVEHETLLTEPLVWVSSKRHLTHEQQPLPIAIESNCLWGKWALMALDEAGVIYRLAYSTFSFGGIVAIVEAGLAVSVMTRSAVLPGLRILGPAECLPLLPAASIGLVQQRTAPGTPASLRLAAHIRQHLTLQRTAA